MATITIKRRICDLHERQGEQVDAKKRSLTIDGKRFTPDWCDPCWAEYVEPLLAMLKPPRRRGGGAVTRKGPDPAQVRRWARDNGVEVSATGRVPAAVTEQYLAAQ